MLSVSAEEPNITIPELRKRAVAIGILGEVFEKVQKDENSNPPLVKPATSSTSTSATSPSSSGRSTPIPKPTSNPTPTPQPYKAGPKGSGSIPTGTRTAKPGTEGLKGPLW